MYTHPQTPTKSSLSHTHAHARTHARTHARSHARTDARSHTYAHVCSHTYAFFIIISISTLLEGSRIETSRDSLLTMHAVGVSSPGHNQMLGQIPNKNIDPWRWACRQMLRSGQKHTHTLEIRWSGKATLHYSVVVHRRRRRWRGVQTVAGDWHCLLLLRQPGPASH